MFSGGEPTIHRHILDFIDLAQGRPIGNVTVNTNGIRLAADRRFAAALGQRNRAPGKTVSIYLQFDGFDERTRQQIRGRDLRKVKQRALDNCATRILLPDVIASVGAGCRPRAGRRLGPAGCPAAEPGHRPAGAPRHCFCRSGPGRAMHAARRRPPGRPRPRRRRRDRLAGQPPLSLIRAEATLPLPVLAHQPGRGQMDSHASHAGWPAYFSPRPACMLQNPPHLRRPGRVGELDPDTPGLQLGMVPQHLGRHGGQPAMEPERTLSRFREVKRGCPGWGAGSLACVLVQPQRSENVPP